MLFVHLQPKKPVRDERTTCMSFVRRCQQPGLHESTPCSLTFYLCNATDDHVVGTPFSSSRSSPAFVNQTDNRQREEDILASGCPSTRPQQHSPINLRLSHPHHHHHHHQSLKSTIARARTQRTKRGKETRTRRHRNNRRPNHDTTK